MTFFVLDELLRLALDEVFTLVTDTFLISALVVLAVTESATKHN
jgi:hypothetical protein